MADNAKLLADTTVKFQDLIQLKSINGGFGTTTGQTRNNCGKTEHEIKFIDNGTLKLMWFLPKYFTVVIEELPVPSVSAGPYVSAGPSVPSVSDEENEDEDEEGCSECRDCEYCIDNIIKTTGGYEFCEHGCNCHFSKSQLLEFYFKAFNMNEALVEENRVIVVENATLTSENASLKARLALLEAQHTTAVPSFASPVGDAWHNTPA